MWRNPEGPRFGLIGVVRHYRNTVIAAALLKQVLTAAATWGHASFTTETSVLNRAIYPRLKRIGAECVGRFLQLVHPAALNGTVGVPVPVLEPLDHVVDRVREGFDVGRFNGRP